MYDLTFEQTICTVCGANDCQERVFCEFCESPICLACDHHTDFGHTCDECWAKVVTGAIDDSGVDRSPHPYQRSGRG